ncbi:EAL domain-containing protein [Roseiconus lacunae]|uniref:EAL domain-containing protein n=1 Tax=Roseiconus lacunae TaxID=2605694 RepID=UPI001E304237|nr:EAL domain-containing protein [Roseiconus lacunae]MCD0457950.1 EAL domain-containing protein [Roseiconus lacunae]
MSVSNQSVSNEALSIPLSTNHRWTLTEFGQGDHQQRTFDLPNRTVVIGRSGEADLTVAAKGISKRHAQISFLEGEMLVKDLGSTNGTYLNGHRIDCSTVVAGDLIQFANALYKVGRRGDSVADGTMEEGIVPWAQTLLLFDRLMTDRAVVPFYQPIVTLKDQATIAFEVLARSDLENLSNPALMFGAAERLGQQCALSELMRGEGVRIAADSSLGSTELFLNTHPSEVITDRLIQSLRDLRAEFPDASMTIEIHESSITDPNSMRRFRAVLRELDMKLSYDDFGAGQGRLLELAEVPPDVLKFDMGLIRSIDSAPSTRIDLLRSLVKLARDAGSTTLAEGVETEGEHHCCCELGIELGQGYFYGRPAPMTAI